MPDVYSRLADPQGLESARAHPAWRPLLGSSATARRAREPRTASRLVAFIIAAIVAPTAIKPPGQEFDGGGRRRFSMRHSGEMSSTHHRLIF